jgi:putative tryptophan/tyrosine transport system substrate-binding protein
MSIENWYPSALCSASAGQCMKRREFIGLVGGGAVAWPLAAAGQQPDRVRRVGLLTSLPEKDPEAPAQVMSLRSGLQELGWTDLSLRIETRWTGGDVERARAYAAELVGLADVILAVGTVQLSMLLRETQTVPIVFAQVGDPVALGFVASMAHPGGNTTGFSEFDFTIGEKWLEGLKEIAPQINRVALVHNPDEAQAPGYVRSVEAVAPSLGLQLIRTVVHDADEIERGFNTLASEANAGLIVVPSPINSRYRGQIISLAAQHRLPAIYPFRYFATSGGLISYGVVTNDLIRRAASYVDRILKGAKAADLPVQGPTKFEMVINLKTAKALGLTVPPTLLTRADEVIE